QTVASQLTAPKCRSRRWSDHSFLNSNVRRYQTRSAGFITPDNADSTGNGTRICPSSFLPIGGSSSFCAAANSHRPLRFIHSLRTIVGGGYSGKTLSGATSLAHFVIRGPFAACQSAARAGASRMSDTRERRIVRTGGRSYG